MALPKPLPPGVDFVDFCAQIIVAVAGYAACVKPNAAFFEALGDEGYGVLADRFERHGVPPERAAILAVGAVGALDQATLDGIKQAIATRIEAAIKFSEQSPRPEPSEVATDVYTSWPGAR